MNLLGLIGNPISHSQSPALFESFFKKENLSQWEYRLFEMSDLSELPSLLNLLELRGFNVTIPFKESILPMLHEMDSTALETGAVNTVVVSKKGDLSHLKGYNTDVHGFEKSLAESFGLSQKRALILGNGGAAKAVKYVLKRAKIPFTVVGRSASADLGYSSLNETVMHAHSLIINTTPLGGAHSSLEAPPIPYSFLTKQHHCFDLVYTPEITGFLAQCAPFCSNLKNGKSMLRYQAEASWELFKP